MLLLLCARLIESIPSSTEETEIFPLSSFCAVSDFNKLRQLSICEGEQLFLWSKVQISIILINKHFITLIQREQTLRMGMCHDF